MALSIKELDLKGKRVFIRVDFNVPLKNGIILDDTRINEAMQTVEYARKAGGRVILASHLGRPKGEKVPEMSLKPVAEYISVKFFHVSFVEDCIGDKVLARVNEMRDGEVLLLENLRYYNGEEKNLPEFVDKLAKLTDVYINDAFGTCHRKHASVYGLPERIEQKAAGFLVEREIRYFEKLLKEADKPFADRIFIGGAMAYTFLKFTGVSVGKSLVENDQGDTVERILRKARGKGVKIYLPSDHIVAPEFDSPEGVGTLGIGIPEGMMGLDIGPDTVKNYCEALQECKTVLWNGPMGVFEKEQFSNGTFSVARCLADSGAVVVVGGGDSISAAKQAGVSDRLDHLSTGGGASLEYIEFGGLPGIEVLG
jgi:phosphoglycerate kinase